jgi:DNA-binding transcriptional regulator LsrR (DeoR family)
MARNGGDQDGELSLAVRAAWLHYAGALTQAEVARRLGVTSVKAHRLIVRANQEGVIKVVIDGAIADCVRLEARLCDRFGITSCEVVPNLGEEPLPLRALGMAGARFLAREIGAGIPKLIGIGHGRTLSAVVSQLPRMPANGTRFVSLLGGLTRNFAASPHDVMHRLAGKTGAEAYVMPVPFFANTLEDREVMLAQRGVAEVFELAGRSDLKLIGIGTAEPDASLVATGMIEPQEIRDIKRAGGVGELLGHFFDAEGRYLETDLTARTLSLGLDTLRNSRIVAVAGGTAKVCAIRSVLLSGLLSGLISDERTANALLASPININREASHLSP